MDLEEATHQNWPPATAPVRFLRPTAHQSLSSFSHRRRRSSTEQTRRFPPGNLQENCEENNGQTRGGRRKKRAAMAMRAEPGVQIEALSFALLRLCPRVGVFIHRSATASPLPKLPRVGRGCGVINAEFTGFYLPIPGDPCESSLPSLLLRC